MSAVSGTVQAAQTWTVMWT